MSEIISWIKFKAKFILFKYDLPYKVLKKNSHFLINKDSEIVIEGYPRSGNTFFVFLFMMLQERMDMKVAHHLHMPTQIKCGVEQGIPCVLLLRNPVDAVTSYKFRVPEIPISILIEYYYWYHENLMNCKDEIYIIPFEKLYDSVGKLIKEINNDYSTTYKSNKVNQITNQEVFDHIDNNTKRKFGRIAENRVARPSKQRKEQAQAIKEEINHPKNHKKILRAKNVYDIFFNSSI